MRIIMCPEDASLWSVLKCWMGHDSPHTMIETKHAPKDVETLLMAMNNFKMTAVKVYNWSEFGYRCSQRNINTSVEADAVVNTYLQAKSEAGMLAMQRTNVKEKPHVSPFA